MRSRAAGNRALTLRLFDAAATRGALPQDRLIATLREVLRAGATVPQRHAHTLGADATLLLMPAWRAGAKLGVKIVTVFPENGARGLPAVSSTYLLCDGRTGEPLAIMDGAELTARRTAATSALAGDFLARSDAARLLIVGAGHVASQLARAWAAVRPIASVAVWNVRPPGAERLAAALRADGLDAAAATDLAAAARTADIVSCATLATAPLIRGAWLRPGTHLDLIGGYLPTMREADDDALRGATVFIDTEAALAEAGDITQPLESGVLATVAGTLAQLCRGELGGRASTAERTVFKSVGSALQDLAAATLVYDAAR